jgi:hypothetical protein
VRTSCVLLLALASCRSEPQVVERHLGTIRSWVATARMVAERSAGGDVPQAYAVRTLATAADEIEAEVTVALKAVGGSPDAEITRRTRELASRVRRMSADVGRGQRIEHDAEILGARLERLVSSIRRRVNAR